MTIQKKFVVKDGQVCTAHFNRHGKLVIFGRLFGLRFNLMSHHQVMATFFPAHGVQCASLRIPVTHDVIVRTEPVNFFGFSANNGVAERVCHQSHM